MAIANRVVGLIAGLFIVGALGATAVVMVSNQTVYNNTGVPAPVVTVFTVAIPIMAGVALMLYFLPKRTIELKQYALKFVRDKRGALANRVAGLMVALFVLGSIGSTAVILVANSSAYSGAPPAVITVFTVAVPIMAGVALMLYFLPKRGG